MMSYLLTKADFQPVCVCVRALNETMNTDTQKQKFSQ